MLGGVVHGPGGHRHKMIWGAGQILRALVREQLAQEPDGSRLTVGIYGDCTVAISAGGSMRRTSGAAMIHDMMIPTR